MVQRMSVNLKKELCIKEVKGAKHDIMDIKMDFMDICHKNTLIEETI